jgi:SAM-dependent methyltransferase
MSTTVCNNSTLLDSTDAVCPYCRKTGRFDFQFYQRTYFQCPFCRLIYLLRTPKGQDNLLLYYKENYFHDCADDQTERDRMHLNSHILHVIERYHKKGHLLDVGCGCGFFLRTAQKRGWNVFGVDPSEQSIIIAREMVGNDVSVGTVQEIKTMASFDVITMINVIDHLRNPWTDLSHSMNLLRPGGLLYLRFPNGLFHRCIINMSKIITEQPIMNRFLVFHEYAFTPIFIRKFLSEQGFHHIKIQNARLSGADLYQHSPISMFLGGGLNYLIWIALSFFQNISCGRWLVGPSLEVTAFKK